MMEALHPRPSGTPPDPLTILVIDDEELIRALVRRALEPAGYTVVDAGDGLDGLRIVEEESPPVDTVITDLQMPVIDGYDLVHVLSQQRPELPVVVISGNLTNDPRLAGARAVIPKPFTSAVLLKTVAAVLQGSREARAQARAMRALARQQRADAAESRSIAGRQHEKALAMQARHSGLVAAALALRTRMRAP